MITVATPFTANVQRRESASLVVVLRAGEDRRLLAREPVTEADLTEVRAEAWRELLLRRGHSSVPFDAAPLRIVPVIDEATPDRTTGFAVEAELPDGRGSRLEFGVRALGDVARRASARLMDEGLLKKDQTCVFELAAEEDASPPAPAAEAFGISVRTAPLTTLAVPLRPLLQQATPVEVEDDSVFPVFYTAASLARAEKFSRRGGALNPPVETGGVTLGSLCVCPDTGEFFAVVTDVVELSEADEKQFSLGYTGRTWARLLTMLRARQQAEPSLRMLGQCHGHNFVPGERCSKCEHAVKCDFTSVFTSADDHRWMRAVFSRQPWALCHIFGLTARNEPVAGLHARHGGSLSARGFFVLPDFNTAGWSVLSGASLPAVR